MSSDRKSVAVLFARDFSTVCLVHVDESIPRCGMVAVLEYILSLFGMRGIKKVHKPRRLVNKAIESFPESLTLLGVLAPRERDQH